ncbi:MAG: peptidylprolyl isomerase [Kiritimatiellae bacterium]|nr:peptidylprolyl isomerase [Kiritimatiellia bacterium]
MRSANRFVGGMLLVGVLASSAPANTLAQFRILGYSLNIQLEVELFDEEKPLTVANFVRLVESGAYARMFFHRLIPGFVIQGGGYRASPSYTGVEEVPHFGAISNEFATGPLRSNVRGTLAMAKVAGDPDSATCQFFINLGDNSANLDTQNGGFTVFGRVISDPQGALDFWNSLSKGVGIVDVGEPFEDLPVNYAGQQPPTFGNLIYCEISLLRISVSNAPGARILSWPTAVGLTNHLEAATSPAGPWTVVWSGVSAAPVITYADTNNAPTRFYRVRVR